MKWKTCKPKKNNVVTYVGFDRNIRNMKIQADTQKETKSWKWSCDIWNLF